MNEGEVGGLADDLVRIHRAISRGFMVAADASHSFARNGFDDEELKLGFLNYVRAHVAILAAHHRAEDEVAFPRLRERLPEAPYDTLLAEHRHMEPFFEQMRLAIADIRIGKHVKESLEVLVYALNMNRELWRPHIYQEETHFNAEAVNAVFEADEQNEISQAMARCSQQNAKPDSLVIPFILYNLAPADRAGFSAHLQPVLLARMNEEWKGQWRTMKPFLLP